MPDISMCENNKCPLRKNCYRFLARAGYVQVYSDFAPDEKGKCDGYWEITSNMPVNMNLFIELNKTTE